MEDDTLYFLASLKRSLKKTDGMLCVVRKRRRGSDRPESSHASVCSQSPTHSCTPPLYIYGRSVKYDGREAGGTFTEMRGLPHLQIGNFGTESAENSAKKPDFRRKKAPVQPY
jgi:hypothetical protein